MFIAEPILKAVPQVHIMFILWDLLGYRITGQNIAFFQAAFLSSVFSASNGIAGFLLHGPCKLVSTDGLFGGMGKLGFILLVLNIATTLCGKGVVLGFIFKGPVSFTPLAFSKIYLMIFLSFRKKLLIVLSIGPVAIFCPNWF